MESYHPNTNSFLVNAYKSKNMHNCKVDCECKRLQFVQGSLQFGVYGKPQVFESQFESPLKNFQNFEIESAW